MDIEKQSITLIATVAMGLESVLAQELRQLGYNQLTVENGRVQFEANAEDIIKCNLWLRTAGRVFVKIGEFKAFSFDELFEKTKALPWQNWIEKTGQFPVSKISSKNSTLFSKSDSQAVVKKAVVESLKKAYKVNTLPETGAQFPIRVQIERDLVTLSIDTSGEGLHKRGYRAHMSKAPLRETLAAGLLYLSRWRPKEDALIDPMCGTGTILIEAALMAHNIAPGLNRTSISENWSLLPINSWKRYRKEAGEQIDRTIKPRILGSDNNGKALKIARENIEIASVETVFVQKLDVTECRSRYEKGKLVTNPPYGERLGEKQEAEVLYEDLGVLCRDHFPNWNYYILTSHPEFEDFFGKKATRKRKLFNGSIRCDYYSFY